MESTVDNEIRLLEKQLTKKQVKFVYELHEQKGNQTKAYKAVYNVKSDKVAGNAASRLLENVGIFKLYELIQKKFKESFLETKEDIINHLRKLIKESGEMQVFYDKEGNVRKAYLSAQVQMKAIEELNKMLGNYAPEKSEVNLRGVELQTENTTAFAEFIKQKNRKQKNERLSR